MITLLTALGYLLGAGLCHLLVFFTGAAICPPSSDHRLSERLVSIVITHALGLIAVSMSVAFLGLLSLLKTWTVLPLLVLAVLVGVLRIHRSSLFEGWEIVPTLRRHWRDLPRSYQVLALLFSGPLLLMSTNILLGGLAPDMAQDSLWYHLTVPGQWILLGDVRMFPLQMQSTFTLAAEAVYAPILMFGNEVLLHEFHAQFLLLLLWMIPLGTVWFSGVLSGLLACIILIPLVGVSIGTVPVTVKNDRFAAYFLYVGIILLTRIVREQRNTRNAVLAGSVLGMLTALKMVTLAYWVPAIAVYTAYLIKEKGLNQTSRIIAIAVVAGILVYSPWAIRGFIYSGNPLYPLGKGLIETHDELRPALEASADKHRFYSLTREDLSLLAEDAWRKIRITQNNLDPVLILLFASAVFCCFRKRGWQLGPMILAMFAGLFLVRGRNDPVRFFTTVYPAGCLAIALLFDSLDKHLSKRLAIASWVLLSAASFFTYGRTQYERGRLRTTQWPYRPVLSEPLLTEYAEHQALGGYYLSLREARDHIPEDAAVLLPDAYYPYYLKRRMYWAGVAIKGGILGNWWGDMDSDSAYQDLLDRDIDYVLTLGYPQVGVSIPNLTDSRFLDMERNGQLEAVEENTQRHWRLWRVVD